MRGLESGRAGFRSCSATFWIILGTLIKLPCLSVLICNPGMMGPPPWGAHEEERDLCMSGSWCRPPRMHPLFSVVEVVPRGCGVAQW